MNKPKTQTAEVLYELLTNSETTRRDFLLRTGILNPTARIADLRHDHGLNVKCSSVKTTNKHGRKIKFGAWSLPVDEKERALKVYAEINQ